MARRIELSPAEWAVLGVFGEGATHGFAVAQLLDRSGPLGRVWTLPRPQVYQALKKLGQQELLVEASTERSTSGPARTIYALTPSGRRALDDWLSSPVEHVRDIRSMLLLKLALLDRSGAGNAELLESQRRSLEPQIASLTSLRDQAVGFERVLAEWRLTSSQATLSFLRTIAERAAQPASPSTNG